jgi:hypothetical protein
LAFLQEHEFLTPRQVQQLGAGSGMKFVDGRALARELIVRDWLTPYQANQLLQGRGAELLLGPYRLMDRLGEGGMGQVFKAHHVRMDRTVALKMISKSRVSNPMALARFYREVRAVAKLSHPNIVVAFEVNQVGETPYLAMENVDGIDRVCRTILWKWRKRLGVPSVNLGSEELRAANARRPEHWTASLAYRTDLWTPEEDALLGTATDGCIAARLGRSTNAVQHRRQRLGIRPFGRRWH